MHLGSFLKSLSWKALVAGAIIGAFDGLYNLIPSWLRTIPAVLSLGLIPLNRQA